MVHKVHLIAPGESSLKHTGNGDIASVSFMRRRRSWFDDASSSIDESMDGFVLEDTLDICNYRIVEKYDVNRVKRSEEDDSSFNCEETNVSVEWNDFQDSMEQPEVISMIQFKDNLEDTMSVCNYRRRVPVGPTNSFNDSHAHNSTSQSAESIVEIYSFDESSDSNAQFNGSTESNAYLSTQSTTFLTANESRAELDDSMQICSYRRSSMDEINGAYGYKIKTPTRSSRSIAFYLAKTVVPKALFTANASTVGATANSPRFRHRK